MKHTKIKRFIAACLAAVTTAGCASLLAYAENERFGGNYAIDDSGEYQKYFDSLTDEQRKIIEEKEKIAADFDSNPFAGMYAATGEAYLDLPGTFSMYQQQTLSYCVPACIQSVLVYINGISPDQGDIYPFVNIYFDRIPGYINPRLTKHTYVFWTAEKIEDRLTYFITQDVAAAKVPTFIRIVVPKNSEWHYETDGHCVLSNGISVDQSMIRIADPNGGLEPDFPTFYRMKSEIVGKYTTSICW